MRRAVAAVLLVAACHAGTPAPDAGVPAAPPPPRAETHVVRIEQMAFHPADLVLRPGDTIEWQNADLVPHTATATDKSFDSGVIAPGAKWRVTVGHAGTTSYACLLHPMMKGSLTAH